MHTLLEIVQSSHTDQWVDRHANGEVPDSLPYGLDKLARHGIHPIWPAREHGSIALIARIAAKVTGVHCVESWHMPIRSIHARLCWDERTGIPAAMDPRTRRLPVVSGVIWATSPDAPTRIRALLKCAFKSEKHALFVLSRAQLGVLRSMTKVYVEYIPFGIDADFWNQTDEPMTRERLVVSAGNDRHRDYDTLISSVLGSHPGNLLAIASTRPIVSNERLFVKPLSHLGLRDLYRKARVVAVATRRNDHCSGVTALLEAMSCGRPVVACAHPGIDDYIQHGITGMLVPPGDVDAFARAVNLLLDDPDRAYEMGVAAASRVRDRFTSDHMASGLANLLCKFAPC